GDIRARLAGSDADRRLYRSGRPPQCHGNWTSVRRMVVALARGGLSCVVRAMPARTRTAQRWLLRANRSSRRNE
ncbi:MAG TPA: hypothetical protein VN130_11645, partial [Xanthobacteraceae bacterium]|nr:hypothetical protein [Xanthobacteraceae bacterium]